MFFPYTRQDHLLAYEHTLSSTSNILEDTKLNMMVECYSLHGDDACTRSAKVKKNLKPMYSYTTYFTPWHLLCHQH